MRSYSHLVPWWLLWVSLPQGYQQEITLPGLGFYVTEGLSWNQAMENCAGRGMTMISINDTREYEILGDYLGNHDIAQTTWLSGLEIHGPWKWSSDGAELIDSFVGCYSGLSHGYQFDDNQPASCNSFCKTQSKSQFSGLQGKKCICFNDLKDVKEEDGDLCNITCPGMPSDPCGGPAAMSVFNVSESMRWKLYDPESAGKGQDCVLMVQDDKQDIIMYSANCSLSFNFLCQLDETRDCTRESNGICYVFPKLSLNWYDAAQYCSELGGTLVDRPIENLRNIKLDIQSFLWMGLSRVRQVWNTGKSISYALPRTHQNRNNESCITFEPHKDDNWTLGSTACHMRLPFICRYRSPGILSYDEVITYIEASNNVTSTALKLTVTIILPIVGGLLFVWLVIVLIIFFIHKRRSNYVVHQKQKPNKRPEPFYFVLEKEENLYNTIDGISCENLSAGSSPETPRYATVPNTSEEEGGYDTFPDVASVPGPSSKTMPCSSEHTYNHLYILGKKVPEYDSMSERSHSTARYDRTHQRGNEYDTISNVRQKIAEIEFLHPNKSHTTERVKGPKPPSNKNRVTMRVDGHNRFVSRLYFSR